mmetsp:Transcript_11139/g.18194  ORF Transcript_11139/g.18194 Transcript_11139/m.18194 type:complete len:87 (+) Transcript_11139:55-315(+)
MSVVVIIQQAITTLLMISLISTQSMTVSDSSILHVYSGRVGARQQMKTNHRVGGIPPSDVCRCDYTASNYNITDDFLDFDTVNDSQ